MDSKDDDTLPLPGFSDEFSIDVTADEDFIPTSQPRSNGTSKCSKTSDPLTRKSSEDSSTTSTISDSRIEDTLPTSAIIDHLSIDQDKSVDFIPDTETKQSTMTYSKEDISCKKKLPVLGPEDVIGALSGSLWDTEVSKIPESPALESQNFHSLNESLVKSLPLNQELAKICEDSITEIIVNDSSETVDLETTPLRTTSSKSEIDVENFPPSSSGSFVRKCEERQIFDSSVLLLDQPGCSRLNEPAMSSERLYLQETIEDESQGPGISQKTDVKKTEGVTTAQESEEEFTPPVTRKIEMKLKTTCLIFINPKTNKIARKIILDANEIPSKPRTKPRFPTIDPFSDTNSEKSKRHSTSSSSSVYSDVTGLPFALPVRMSTVSETTDSSEDDIALRRQRERKALGRIPWSNEYLLPLKMDEILQSSLDSCELLRRPNVTSPTKPPERGFDDTEEGSEACSPEAKTDDSVISQVRNSEEGLVEKKTESSEKVEEVEPENEPVGEEVKQPTPQQTEEEIASITLTDGLPVFARWTDKRYYSGFLSGEMKNDRWEVKFDDGTVKTVRKEFIMPAQWVEVGALVFALNDDGYVSGRIANIQRGENVIYVVELDNEKTEISVKVSDLSLTDVMAGIIREKYRPMGETPKGKADIDFDNVLSGKRIREQRTPLRPPASVQSKSSGTRRKSSSTKTRKELESIKETPQSSEGKIPGLNSEGGHLVEDKIISTDSLSGNDDGKTPLRGISKEGRKKAKPRSLSYETEETHLGKITTSAYDSPTPGPSGVKFKKEKTTNIKAPVVEKAVTTRSGKKTPAIKSTEKSKLKRKLEESGDDVHKKAKGKGKSKKG